MNNDRKYESLCKEVGERFNSYYVALYERDGNSVIIGLTLDKNKIEEIVSSCILGDGEVSIYQLNPSGAEK